MATMFRPSTRIAGFAVASAAMGYGVSRYSNSTNSWPTTAHAESLPSDSKAALKKLPWKGFTELKLESAEMVNHNVKKLTFLLPDDESITGLAPVKSLLTQHTPEGAWIPVFRPYTPVSANNEPGRVTFMVKRYPGGKGSGKMHSLIPGDTMKFKPIPEFDYKPNEFSHMTFIAGGSGITPIYQLTQAILRNPEDQTKITLVYANNSEEDILLRKEFDEIASRYPGRFQKLYTVNKESSEGDGMFEKGYITKQMLQKVMPSKIGERNVKVLVSGPPKMTESIAGAKGGFGWTQGSLGGILSELGYTKEEVHKF
jgi:cytochrome-b5 reductase